MEVEKTHEDDRGKIWTLNHNEREYILFTIKEGKARGGDYHETDQHDIVLRGVVKAKRAKPTDGVLENTCILKEGDSTTFSSGIPHILIAEKDSLVLEWLEGDFEKEYYPPYRKEVEER